MRPPRVRHSAARLPTPARNSIGLCTRCGAAVARVHRAPLRPVTPWHGPTRVKMA